LTRGFEFGDFSHPRRDLFIRELDIQFIVGYVYIDDITVFDRRNRPSESGFRSDMPNGCSARTAGDRPSVIKATDSEQTHTAQ